MINFVHNHAKDVDQKKEKITFENWPQEFFVCEKIPIFRKFAFK